MPIASTTDSPPGIARTATLFFVICLAIALPLAAMLPNPSSDTTEYFTLARNLLAGHGYSMDAGPPFHASAWRVPGYPAFVALLLQLGIDEKGIQLIQAVLCAVSATLALVMVDSLYPGQRRLMFAFCLLLSLPLLEMAPSLTPESLNCLVVLAAFACAAKRGSHMQLAAGALLGIATLLRPENLIVAGLLGALLSLTQKSWRGGLLMGAGFVLALSPWLVRNWQETRILGVTDPIYSYSNLPLGTSGDYNDPVSSLRNRYNSGEITAGQRDAYVKLARDTFVQRWREHPLQVAKLKLTLLARTVSSGMDGVVPDSWSFSQLWADRNWPGLLFRFGFQLVFGPVFVVLAIAGLAARRFSADQVAWQTAHFIGIAAMAVGIYAEQRMFIPGRLLLLPLLVAGLLHLRTTWWAR